jgi:hypothetical protein
MSDTNERPVASAGSHREPVAWAVVLADGQRIYDVYGIEEEAKAIDEAVTGNHGIIPLYRSPALTDAEREAMDPVDFGGLTDKEREALEWAARSALAWTNEAARCKSALSRIALSDRTAKQHFAVIRGLVERAK